MSWQPRHSVGFVSPLPPVRSGIADYSAELLPALRRHVDATVYSPESASEALEAGHDVLLFQIGNDPMHAPSLEALRDPSRKTPAVVVLHDFVLHHLFAAAYLERGRQEEYEQELVRAHGERGRLLAMRMRRGPKLPIYEFDPWNWPMSATVIRQATTLIVHSSVVLGAVLREHPRARVVEVPHHVVPAPPLDRQRARATLRLPQNRPVAVTLGLLTPAKRTGKILEALALLSPERRPFLFVGGAVGDESLFDSVASFRLQDDVVFGGYLSEEDFWLAAAAADVAINLRHPTMGETSGVVCRLAGAGVPLLVSDTGWFRELPESFASKIPIGRGEAERVAMELTRIAFDPAERAARSRAAIDWGRERSPDLVAAAYAGVLRETVEGRTRSLAVSSFLASELSALGIGRPGSLGTTSREPDAGVVAAVAERAAGVLPIRD